MANYTIEARSLSILGVASHDFWVLRNSDTGNFIAELHGLATDRATGLPVPIGTDDKLYSLRAWEYVHDPSYAEQKGVPISGSPYIANGQSSFVVFSGDSQEALARWNAAVDTIPLLNLLDLDYPAYGVNIISETVNSNSTFRTLGEIMGVEVHNFSNTIEPGLDNKMLPENVINSITYHPDNYISPFDKIFATNEANIILREGIDANGFQFAIYLKQNGTLITDREIRDPTTSLTTLQRTETYISNDAKVTKTYISDQNGNFTNNPEINVTLPKTAISFEQIGSVFGSVLAKQLAGDNVFAQITLDTVFETTLDTIGKTLDVYGSGVALQGIGNGSVSISGAFDYSVKKVGTTAYSNLQGAGIGVISSLLTAHLLDGLGLDTLPQGILSTLSNKEFEIVLSNLANGKVWSSGLTDIASLGNAVGAYFGSYLASELYIPETTEGQIGSQIGSAIGAIAGTYLIPIPIIGTAIGAFVGDLIGGMFGDLFGDPDIPHAGAIVSFNPSTQTFSIVSTWAENDGSGNIANQLGTAAVDTLNSILQAIHGTVQNLDNLHGGSYGHEGNELAYWIDGGLAHGYVSFAKPGDLISYGVINGLKDIEISGGDIFEKRAFYATLSQAVLSTTNILNTLIITHPTIEVLSTTDILNTLQGNLGIAAEYGKYLKNAAVINSIIATDPHSAFAIGWIIIIAQASQLGLDQRHAEDWIGGWKAFIVDNKLNPHTINFNLQQYDRIIAGTQTTDNKQIALHDNINPIAKEVFTASSQNSVIEIDGKTIANLNGFTGQHTVVGDKVAIAPYIIGGTGADTITTGDQGADAVGGAGNDTLNGGMLSDWLFGGAGDDVISSGNGDGNYLSGGEGNDALVGGNDSDWLDGGAGNDSLSGMAGNDIFSDGGGIDLFIGGGGKDIYMPTETIATTNITIINGTASNNAAMGELDIALGITTANILFNKVYDNLLISGIGSNDKITIMNWFSDCYSQLQTIVTGDSVSFTNIASDKISSKNYAANTSEEIAFAPYTGVASAIDFFDGVDAEVRIQTKTLFNWDLNSSQIDDPLINKSQIKLINPNSVIATKLQNFTGFNGTGAHTYDTSNWIKGGSQEYWFNPSDTIASRIKNFMDVNGTGGETDEIINWTAGGSQLQWFYPSKSIASKIQNFNSANGTGKHTYDIVNWADGGSQIKWFKPSKAIATELQNFAEENGTGTLISDTFNWTMGGSQVKQFDPSSSITTELHNFAGANGTGKHIYDTFNWATGGSQLKWYSPSSAIKTEIHNFKGVNGTGKHINDIFNWSAGGSQIQWFTPGSGVASKLENFKGVNGTGTHTYDILNWSMGGSRLQWFNPSKAIASELQDFKGANGTGTHVYDTINWTTGGSQQQWFNPSDVVASQIKNFTGKNGTGTHTYDIFNWSAGGSQMQWFNPSKAITSEFQNFTDVNGSGTHTYDIINWSAGGSQEIIFSGLPLGISKEIINHSDANGTGSIISASFHGNVNDNTLTPTVANEALIGNGGYDSYLFGRGDGQVVIRNGITIIDNATGELQFDSGIDINQIWLEREGNDLLLDIMGTFDTVTISDWFSNSVSKLEEIKTSDGNMLDSQISNLLHVMENYAANHPEFDVTASTTVTLIANNPILNSALETAWHY